MSWNLCYLDIWNKACLNLLFCFSFYCTRDVSIWWQAEGQTVVISWVLGVSQRACVIHLLNLGKSSYTFPVEEISIFMFLSNTFKQLLSMLMFLFWVLNVIKCTVLTYKFCCFFDSKDLGFSSNWRVSATYCWASYITSLDIASSFSKSQ